MNIRVAGAVKQKFELGAAGTGTCIRWLCHGHQNHGECCIKCWRGAVPENKIKIAGSRSPSRKFLWQAENAGHSSTSLDYSLMDSFAKVVFPGPPNLTIPKI